MGYYTRNIALENAFLVEIDGRKQNINTSIFIILAAVGPEEGVPKAGAQLPSRQEQGTGRRGGIQGINNDSNMHERKENSD